MISYDDEKHTYTDTETGMKLISVTQLMKKHEIGANYFGVDDAVLKIAAEKGKIVHKEIEDYIKTGEMGFTPDLGNFINYINLNKAQVLASEMQIADDLVAGTLDLIVKYLDGCVIADIKTTSEIHYEAVSWQLSIYKYLVEKVCGDIYKMDNQVGQCFWFHPDGVLEVVNINLKPIDEVQRLMDCERVGIKFIPAGLVDIENQLVLMEQFTMAMEFLEQQQAELEAKKDAMKQQIMAAMKSRSIYKFQNDFISLSYTPAKNRTTFDKDKFKAENPEMYEKYNTKESSSAESLRITVRKGAKK